MDDMHYAVVRAIVALNFNEPEKALRILIEALSGYYFETGKEDTHGNRPAAA